MEERDWKGEFPAGNGREEMEEEELELELIVGILQGKSLREDEVKGGERGGR